MPISHCFNWYSFVIELEIREHDAPSFLSLSQDCFGDSWSLLWLYKLTVICSISVKNAFYYSSCAFSRILYEGYLQDVVMVRLAFFKDSSMLWVVFFVLVRC